MVTDYSGRQKITGYAWLRGAGAREVYNVIQLAKTLTPGVFFTTSGVYGCFVLFAAESRDPDRLVRIRKEVERLREFIADSIPTATFEVTDDAA